jgi:hypothetical protein
MENWNVVDLTSHLSTPREPILKKISELATDNTTSLDFLNSLGSWHCTPGAMSR